MSGHSKWHTIKHKKGAADAKRGKVFTRIIKELTIAARGGAATSTATQVATVVAEPSREHPADNISARSARHRRMPGVSYDEITYEGYGPGGAALIIDTLTDNKNRTVARSVTCSQFGGNLAAETASPGCSTEVNRVDRPSRTRTR